MLFNVTRSFEMPAKDLGRGEHSLDAKVKVKWGKHIFTERGEAAGKTQVCKVRVE